MNSFDTLIVGFGCAALKCADELLRMGRKSVALITDSTKFGTSGNAGSDKQTYYKLTLSGSDGDSVGEMAKNFFSGGCVDGPNALCEAALSAKSFLRLCDLGVPFPMNRYGEYIGYRTDHDPRKRATSAGPLTSKMMTEALEKSVRNQNAVILENKLAIRILTENGKAKGIVVLNTLLNTFETYFCNHLVWATGGPADIYKNVSYPTQQKGMSGAVFMTGAAGNNLTEWQNGLGSVSPHWNVSGTYMQVLPKFVSTDENGNDAKEFLLPGFRDEGDMITSVFLKGYQWPFDARKAENGSSRVDLMVASEIRKGRRVFLDFRENPIKDRFDFSSLSKEAYEYLASAGALFGTPYERLNHMNRPAIDFYLTHGVDLEKEMLEIALCAQHMNGGIMVDEWWQTEIENLYAIGEAAGTHGVYRPGGSALNAGQVGGARAARRISRTKEKEAEIVDAANVLSEVESIAELCLKDESNLMRIKDEQSIRMNRFAAAVREKTELKSFIEDTKCLIDNFSEKVSYSDKRELASLFRFYDSLVTRYLVLTAMKAYSDNGGVNRGSGLYTENGIPQPHSDYDPSADKVQMVRYIGSNAEVSVRSVKPIPEEDDFFENVWRDFRYNMW